MELLERFLLGGFIVSAFAAGGNVLRPKSFAGLFGAAPSIALATLGLTLISDGKQYAALEARSMIFGAAAFLAYALACVYLLAKRHIRVGPAAVAMFPVWGASAFALWWTFLR